MPVKKFNLFPREIENKSYFFNLCPWNRFFLPVKKREKKRKCAREKKGREKGQNLAKKWAWKPFFPREKIQKKAKNGFHGHFSFSREKHCRQIHFKYNTVLFNRNSPPWLRAKSWYFHTGRLEQPPPSIVWHFPLFSELKILKVKKNKGTPFKFFKSKPTSKMLIENSPPLIKEDFWSQGGAVPVE